MADEIVSAEIDAKTERPASDGMEDESRRKTDIDEDKGFAGIHSKYWQLASAFFFLLGAVCYGVNGIIWLHLEYRYVDFKKQTTAAPSAVKVTTTTNTSSGQEELAHVSGRNEYYNYYQTRQMEYDEVAKWWEVVGAIFYTLNPLFEFGTGVLGQLCTKKCCRQNTCAEAFWNVPWEPFGSILFLVGSILYLVNVFVPLLAKDGYDDAIYGVVDFFAATVFVVDAIMYLIARISSKRKQRGTSDETSILCCHSNYRGLFFVDWGFWGDILFLLGSLVDTVDHFHYTNQLNLLSCVLWGTDAALYILEWVFVHKFHKNRLGNDISVDGADDAGDIEMMKNPIPNDNIKN